MSVRGGVQRVMVLIDWNSQLHVCSTAFMEDEYSKIRCTWKKIKKRLNSTFFKNSKRFDVSFRIYYGWRKGFEDQPSYRNMKTFLNSDSFYADMGEPNVVFRAGEHFGDKLLAAEETRLYIAKDCHLPDTLRRREDGNVEEKMVDTALASDCVFLAFDEPDMWLIIMGEDDDLIPPVCTAEHVQKRNGGEGRVFLMRDRGQSGVASRQLGGVLIGRGDRVLQ